MGCFRKLKGLKKVLIKGDLKEEYVTNLLRYMNKPPVDWTTTGPMISIVPKSHC